MYRNTFNAKRLNKQAKCYANVVKIMFNAEEF